MNIRVWLLLVFCGVCLTGCLAPADTIPIEVDINSGSTPEITVYQANEATIRATFFTGTNRINLTGRNPFMYWTASVLNPSIVTASVDIVSAVSGIVDFAFSPRDLNYSNGISTAIYGTGFKTGPQTLKRGSFVIEADAAITGVAMIPWSTNYNWGLINWVGLPNYIEEDAGGEGIFARQSNAWVNILTDLQNIYSISNALNSKITGVSSSKVDLLLWVAGSNALSGRIDTLDSSKASQTQATGLTNGIINLRADLGTASNALETTKANKSDTNTVWDAVHQRVSNSVYIASTAALWTAIGSIISADNSLTNIVGAGAPFVFTRTNAQGYLWIDLSILTDTVGRAWAVAGSNLASSAYTLGLNPDTDTTARAWAVAGSNLAADVFIVANGPRTDAVARANINHTSNELAAVRLYGTNFLFTNSLSKVLAASTYATDAQRIADSNGLSAVDATKISSVTASSSFYLASNPSLFQTGVAVSNAFQPLFSSFLAISNTGGGAIIISNTSAGGVAFWGSIAWKYTLMSVQTQRHVYLYSNGSFYHTDASFTELGNRFWDDGNDGAGTGLDADVLDALDSSHFLNYANITNTGGVATGVGVTNAIALTEAIARQAQVLGTNTEVIARQAQVLGTNTEVIARQAQVNASNAVTQAAAASNALTGITGVNFTNDLYQGTQITNANINASNALTQVGVVSNVFRLDLGLEITNRVGSLVGLSNGLAATVIVANQAQVNATNINLALIASSNTLNLVDGSLITNLLYKGTQITNLQVLASNASTVASAAVPYLSFTSGVSGIMATLGYFSSTGGPITGRAILSPTGAADSAESYSIGFMARSVSSTLETGRLFASHAGGTDLRLYFQPTPSSTAGKVWTDAELDPSIFRSIAAEALFNTNLVKVFYGSPTGATQIADSATTFSLRVPTTTAPTNIYFGMANIGGSGTNWRRMTLEATVP